MRWVWTIALAGCLAAAAAAQSVAGAVALAGQHGARAGVCVLDEHGRVVYEHRADEAFAPASNQKVLTAAAVLRGLGADFRFVTRFELRAGVLVVRASGDPNWITRMHETPDVPTAHAPEAKFGEVVAALQRRGIRALRGIELDPGPFTGPARPASWPQNQLHTYYCAPTGPFVLDQGVFALKVDPAGRRDTAAVTLDGPTFGPHLHGAIELVGRRGVSACGASDRGDHVLVRGKLSRRSPAIRIRAAVRDPRTWYERSLRRMLALGGIAIDPAAPPADGLVHEVRTALAPAILRMLESSSNFDAEQCLRVLSARTRGDGTLAGGVAALRAELSALGLELPESIVLADGSGLSRDNRITARLVADVLHRARRYPFGGVLRQALPIAGRTGTLENRFEGTALVGRVQAKTGWIRGASALSGYVESGGRTLSFSILMNYDRRKSGVNRHLKRAQERIVAAVAAR